MTGNGGGVFISDSNSIKIQKSDLENNTCQEKGGGIYYFKAIMLGIE